MTTNTNPPAPPAAPPPPAPPAPPAPGAAGAPPVPPAPPAAPSELKLPDGVKVDAKLLESFKATGAELKLDVAGQQKVLDVFLAQQKAEIEADETRFKQQEAKWAEEITKDPELGGAQLAASRTAASKAVMKYGGEPLAQLLKATGLDNNPVLFRTFAKLGKAMGEDTIGGSNAPPAPPAPTLESALYGTPKSA